MINLLDINKILESILKTDTFDVFKEFKLDTYYPINQDIKSILINLNSKKNVRAYFNKNTMSFNGISVIDIKGERFIEFYDDISDMMNKGLDFTELGNDF